MIPHPQTTIQEIGSTDREAIATILEEVKAISEQVEELRPRNPALFFAVGSITNLRYDLAKAKEVAK